ncbi:hypothetical protein F1559_003451 [Cyanidiococcus yangmingshanensis]|uniref:Plastid lipid-associated protein/fibrillin conserved domain-containing protein n=1 Tax=Cyanidiococcus yangmingshanensis TaxID=2690220 RepID=A0A7J7IQ53_9RHOD|nr:hypothetical protein F1559_003451 [Cyanidiococcus yangmingshanensis]
MFGVPLLRASQSSGRAEKAASLCLTGKNFQSPAEAAKVLHRAADSVLLRGSKVETGRVSNPANAFEAQRPGTAAIGAALLHLEKCSKEKTSRLEAGTSAKMDDASIEGSWRLIYSISKRAQRALSERLSEESSDVNIRAGMYFPLEARIHFRTEPESPYHVRFVMNEAYLPLHLLGIQFAGPCVFMKKYNRLLFDFCELRLQSFGLLSPGVRYKKHEPRLEELSLQHRRRLPFFTFFYTDSFILAGRGRGGGLALWAEESDQN